MCKVKILLVVVLIQLGFCAKRDQRHASNKIQYDEKTLDTAIAELTRKDITNPQDLQSIKLASADFLSDATESLRNYNTGVANNTRNNQPGKEALGISQNGAGYLQLISKGFQEEPPKLKANFIQALRDFKQFTVAILKALDKITESTDNNELANNAMLDSIDIGVVLLSKVDAHIQHTRETNGQLLGTINDVLLEVYNALSKISSTHYNITELVINARLFKRRVQLLASRLETWLRSNPDQGDSKTNVMQTVQKIKKLESDIQNKLGAKKITLLTLQTLFKGWLGEIYATTGNFEKRAKGQTPEIVRTFIFDVLGIAINYKVQFEILSQ